MWSRKRWGWGEILKEATVKSHFSLAEKRFKVCGSHMWQGPLPFALRLPASPLISGLLVWPQNSKDLRYIVT